MPMPEMDGSAPRAPNPSRRPLIEDVSTAAFWNVLLLPVLGLVNLVFAVVIRRRFGLVSGVYDVLIGLTSALVQYSSLGIPTGLMKFLPEVHTAYGPQVLRRFLRDAVILRLLLLGLLLIPVNLFADGLSQSFGLGPFGVTYLRIISVLALTRAGLDLAIRALNAFFAQLWSNMLALTQSVLELALVGTALLLGYAIGGVLTSLAVGGVAVAGLGVGCVMWRLRNVLTGSSTAVSDGHPAGLFSGDRRFLRFAAFTYFFGLSGYFTDMGFAAPALAVVLTPEQVALFATAFKLAFMTVALVVVGFRGVYRPLFSYIRIRNDRAQLQRTFDVVSKVQLVVLIPAGLGLIVMAGDYVPLLFGSAFEPAVPIAWVLIAFMYASTAFNLPGIVLSIDEQYRSLVWAQTPVLIATPLFLLVAAWSGLVQAAIVFGGMRLATALCAYVICRRLYGFHFPWAFASRVGGVSVTMAAALAVGRTLWPTSVVEALTLTLAGVLIFMLGVRVTRVIDPVEVEILNRTKIPGRDWVVRWLVPADAQTGTRGPRN